MSKTVLKISTKFSLTGIPDDDKEIRILDILPKELPGMTLTEISKRANISMSTTQRYLKKILNKPTYYRKKKHTVLCLDGKYILQRRKCTTKGLSRNCDLTDETKFNERFDQTVYSLSKTDLSAKKAEEINEHLLLYSANPKFYSEINSNLRYLYNDAIDDIATGERGIYIVLNVADNAHNDMTTAIKNSLKTLYTKSLNKPTSFTQINSKSKK